MLECDLYTCTVSGQPPAASICQDIFSYMRIKILLLTNLYLDLHQGILKCDLYISVPDWALGSTSSALQVVRYHFWWENWNPNHRKPTFKHNIGVWPLYQYLSSLLDRPPGGQISFLKIPRIICTCKTVIKSFLKSILVFLFF